MPKFRTPVVIHDGKKYHPIGAEVELDQSEIDRITAAHGEYAGLARPQDPGNTQVLNVLDDASIDQLNLAAGIHGGHGLQAPQGAGGAQHLMQRRVPGSDAFPSTQFIPTTGDASRPPLVVDQTTKDPLPSDDELEGMNKPALIELAHKRDVSIETNATKAEIITALKKK